MQLQVNPSVYRARLGNSLETMGLSCVLIVCPEPSKVVLASQHAKNVLLAFTLLLLVKHRASSATLANFKTLKARLSAKTVSKVVSNLLRELLAATNAPRELKIVLLDKVPARRVNLASMPTPLGMLRV